MKANILILAASALLSFTTLPLAAGEKTVKHVITPEPDNAWHVRLSMPAWLAGVHGDTGLGGNNVGVSAGFGDLVPHIDMAASFRAEVRKGRFGGYLDFLYLSLSDGIGTDRLVKKLDVRQDEYLGDLGLSWRLIDKPGGYLEVIGGVRYTNLFEEVNLAGNDQRIEEVSTRLAQAGTVSRALLARELSVLAGRDPDVPIAPLAGARPEELAKAVNRIKGNTEQRQKKIERRLKNALNQRISRSDDWVDPYVGLRGRYNLTPKVYLNGRADIGGFGVGSDLTWQASGGLGWQFATNKYLELNYRALSMDYEDNGFSYDMVTRGAELVVGVNF